MCKIYGRYLFFEYRPSFFVDILKISAIIEQYPNYPGVAQLVARLTGGQEAASSSLVTRTIQSVVIVAERLFVTTLCFYIPFC